MFFEKERDHFDNQPYPEFWQKAIEETAVAVSQFCAYYRFDLHFPKKGVQKLQQAGELPADPAERAAFVRKLVTSLIEQSEAVDLWDLFLDPQPIDKRHGQTCFYYSTCTWDLDLEPEQFRVVQAAWKKAGLPEDLFYWSEETVCETLETKGLWRFLFNTVERCYSPREWSKRQQEKESSHE